MENRINKIMTLADDSKYIILKQAIYKNENYYVAVKITDDETDLADISNLDEGNLKIIHEITIDNELAIEDVQDPDLFRLIVKYVGLEE